MKGRITLAVVCLFLAYLGADDLLVWLRNRTPQNVSMLSGEPMREWIEIDAVADLNGAISTSGKIELEALLVPLRRSGDVQEPVQVYMETRNLRWLELFRQMNFGQDTRQQMDSFRAAHAQELLPRATYRGMRLRGIVAYGNIRKLRELAQEGALNLAPATDVVFLIEGKEPAQWRGLFFLAVGLAGFLKLGIDIWKKSRRRERESSSSN